jgi:membrane peptidoglycan carboxypeptidase
MEETPAERFRRLSRSLEETGEMEDADAQDSSAPASSASSPGGVTEGESGPSTAAGQSAEGESPAPAPGEELKPPGGESPAAGESEERHPMLPGEGEPGQPVKMPRVPHWRVRRRISRTGQLIRPPGPVKPAPPSAASKTRRVRRRSARSCFLQMVLAGVFTLTALAFVATGFILYEYFEIASTLPSVEDLKSRAAQFETTRIYDRNGDLLYEILDPNAGRRTYIPFSKISPYMIAASISIEDHNYFSNPGFDPWAILRAFTQNIFSGETISGASTITQQLARALLMTPEERTERSYMRKVREALLAVEITRRYSKEEILELYLNEIPYGNLAYGVEAAAETYFKTTAEKLTLMQASFLAGIPQAPAVYDVYTNRDATLERQRQVLINMVETSQEQNCIYVGSLLPNVCVTLEEVGAAWNEVQNTTFSPPDVFMRYPHWVNYIRLLLESKYDAQTIYRSGFQVYTTLDPALEDLAEEIMKRQVDGLADKHVTGGALAAVRPSTGEILAMVGSPDFSAQPAGQINMALRPRQPGSAIKPLTYTAAFEKGWTPATLIWDVPTEFPPSNDPFDTNPPYKPENYDKKFHGAVTVRTALANSYNIPAVKTLQYAGIYDDPKTPEEDGLLAMARRLGITTLTRQDYGLALTLGGGEVTPLELTAAYAVFANGGVLVPTVAIQKITTYDGKPVYEYAPPEGKQVIRPEHAFLISSILSDNDARTPMFGPNSVLNLPFPAAAKTGTTNNTLDNWTLGYTPDLAAGVWIGNPDNSPMQGTTGITGAAPIWAEFMTRAVPQVTGGGSTPFVVPPGIVQKLICTVSGAEPSKYCPATRTEYFAADQPPLPADQDLWRDALVDTFTGQRATASCAKYLDQELTVAVSDPAARAWLSTPEGMEWAKKNSLPDPIQYYPEGECTVESPHPILEISNPVEGETVTDSKLLIFGKAGATAEFDHFTLDYATDRDPEVWIPIIPQSSTPVTTTGKLAEWDLSRIDDGGVTIRLKVFSKTGGEAEIKVRIILKRPTPIATSTSTPTATATSTPTPTTTLVPTDTPTPTPTDTLTPEITPTETPTETPTG